MSSKLLKLLAVSFAAGNLAVSTIANADSQVRLSCSVAIVYTFSAQDGTVGLTEAYQKDFLVQTAVDFIDNFSTPTRFKEFAASMLPDQTAVAITYFNDVSTFNAIDFSTTLTLLNGRAAATTSGSHTFSTSLPSPGGHHTTDYRVTCGRA